VLVILNFTYQKPDKPIENSPHWRCPHSTHCPYCNEISSQNAEDILS